MNEDAVTPGAEQADTPKGAEAASQAGDTPDIDKLLEEFKEQPKVAEDETTALKKKVEELEKIEVGRQIKAGVEDFVTSVKASLPDDLKEFPDDLIEAVLHKAADDDHRVRLAFVQRNSNPSAWAKIKESIAKKTAEKLSSLPRGNIAQDRKAAQLASRGVSTTEPPEQEIDFSKVDLNQMKEIEKSLPRR